VSEPAAQQLCSWIYFDVAALVVIDI